MTEYYDGLRVKKEKNTAVQSAETRDELTPCPAILIHPLAHQLMKRIFEADATYDPAYPGDVDLRLYAIITERDELKAILREALKEIDDNPDRYEINSWCNECTMGCTPHRFDRGLCWIHKARKLIGEAQ